MTEIHNANLARKYYNPVCRHSKMPQFEEIMEINITMPIFKRENTIQFFDNLMMSKIIQKNQNVFFGIRMIQILDEK